MSMVQAVREALRCNRLQLRMLPGQQSAEQLTQLIFQANHLGWGWACWAKTSNNHAPAAQISCFTPVYISSLLASLKLHSLCVHSGKDLVFVICTTAASRGQQ